MAEDRRVTGRASVSALIAALLASAVDERDAKSGAD
jgi:hypothetical protein